jgi:hypothetical protein
MTEEALIVLHLAPRDEHGERFHDREQPASARVAGFHVDEDVHAHGVRRLGHEEHRRRRAEGSGLVASLVRPAKGVDVVHGREPRRDPRVKDVSPPEAEEARGERHALRGGVGDFRAVVEARRFELDEADPIAWTGFLRCL